VENIKNSWSFKGAACVFIHSWIDLFLDRARLGVPIDIIITSGIYSKIKQKYAPELKILLKTDAHVYVCDKLNISCATTEQFFSLSLNYNNGHHDTKNDLEGNDPASVKWDEDLFEYYKEKSVEIKSCLVINEAVIQELCSQSLLI